jgi:hypothetical protein
MNEKALGFSLSRGKTELPKGSLGSRLCKGEKRSISVVEEKRMLPREGFGALVVFREIERGKGVFSIFLEVGR